MESSDYLYVHPAGALSPSLWDDEDFKKPDIFNDDVTLGSPQSPFARNSFDGGLFPNDDALTWMEKSCNLESLTELCDVSVQDVAAFDKQANNAIVKDKGAITPDVLQVDGVEDLLHDYIDPDVYMVKEERRSSIDSLSSSDGIEDIFSSTRHHAGKDTNFLESNQGWDSRIDQRITAQQPVPNKSTNVGFVSHVRPILPKTTDGFQIVQPVRVVSKPEITQTIKVVPVSSQQQLLLKNPKVINAKTISVKPTSNSVVYPKGNLKVKRLGVSPSSNVGAIKNVRAPGTVQKNAAVRQIARNASIQNFLAALQRPENLTPLQALLQESNRLIQDAESIPDPPIINSVTVSPRSSIQSKDIIEPIVNNPITSPSQSVEIFTEPIVTSPAHSMDIFVEPNISPVCSPTQSVDVFTEPIPSPVSISASSVEIFTEPIVSSPINASSFNQTIASSPGNPVEIITCESVQEKRKINLEDSKINVEDIIVTSYPDLSVPSPNFEVYDYSESASPNESLSQLSDAYPDSSPGGSSSIGYEDCPSLSPFNAKPYSRYGPGRKSRNLPVEEKKNRKKVQNKEAAIRYRQKKRDEYDNFIQEENELIEKNKKLTNQEDSLMMEIKYLKGLMIDLYKAKGVMK